MLDHAMIIIFPSVTTISIILNIKNEKSQQINKTVFFPEINDVIKDFAKSYIIDMILVHGTNNFSKKVYQNLVMDKDIKQYQITWIGEE